MLIYDDNDFGQRITLTDATLRDIDVFHSHGSGLMLIGLQRTRDKEIRLDPGSAAEWAFLCDHFARHQQLPDRGSRSPWTADHYQI